MTDDVCGVLCRATRADARRRHLLDIARTLFIEHGFHRTGIAQIAAASGIKVGQIYRDFDSKEDIIAAICEADVTTWLEEDALDAAVLARDSSAIRQWIARFAELSDSRDTCRMMTEIVAEAGRNHRIAQINHAVDARVRDRLEEALEALAPSADKDDDRAQLVDLILAFGAGMTMRRIMHPELDAALLDRRMATLIERELDDLAG